MAERGLHKVGVEQTRHRLRHLLRPPHNQKAYPPTTTRTRSTYTTYSNQSTSPRALRITLTHSRALKTSVRTSLHWLTGNEGRACSLSSYGMSFSATKLKTFVRSQTVRILLLGVKLDLDEKRGFEAAEWRQFKLFGSFVREL